VAALHTVAPVDAPRNPVRGVPLAARDAAVRGRLEHLSERTDVSGLTARWERALAAPPWDGPPIWLHGDLHPGNLLLGVLGSDPGPGPGPDPGPGPSSNRARSLAAVIDFGDLTAGDPATDLATAWLTFEPDARETFRARLDELTPTDPATWSRALGWAVAMGSALAAHSDDNPRMAALGAHALAELSRP
jgi:aminoglycoside phosphotransferase (APT) family kinase protein